MVPQLLPTSTPAAFSSSSTPQEVTRLVALPTPTPTRAPVSPSPTPSPVSPAPTPRVVRVEVGAEPTPTPGIIEINGGSDDGGPCGPWDGGPYGPPHSTEFGVEYSEQFLEWTPDGSNLIVSDVAEAHFNRSAISIVSAEGSQVRTIVDANPWDEFPYGFYADLSPDGSRIVYTSCEYPRCPKGADCEEVEVDPDDREAFDYEIATIGIDGTSPKRLTRASHYDHYPVWSPDGTRIAFLVSPNLDVPDRVQLFTMSADGSDVSNALTPSSTRVGLYPPSWSPDGQWLAFIAKEGEYRPFHDIIYTVRAEGGSEPKRLYETVALPSWSPDGSRLAFADEYGIHTVRPDGTGLVQVWEKSREYPQMSQVSWSPDGSALLFIAVEELPGHDPEGVFVVGADGSGLRRLPISRLWGWPWPPARAVWSPDGYRVAVYGMGQALGGISPSVVVTITRDVTDMRFLARVDGGRDPRADGRFHAWNPSRSEEPVDPAACSRGFVVPDPESNPGLVSDCETLLTMRDTLAGSAELEWNEDMHIYEWDGVTVDGSPPRVHELALWQRGLRGRLPTELGRLTELRRLQIRGWYGNTEANALTGAIPPDLSSLNKLEYLDLSYNYLSGGIPPELSGLAELRNLDLSYNFLSGSIPLELGGLENLRWLDLGYNNPSLCVPAELPEIWRESVRLCEPEEVGSP